MTTNSGVPAKVDPSDPTKIAESLLTYHPDEGKKATYLSYRLTNFTEMESISLSKIHHKSVMRWRESDPIFKAIDLNENGTLNKMREHYIPLTGFLKMQGLMTQELILIHYFLYILVQMLLKDQLLKQ